MTAARKRILILIALLPVVALFVLPWLYARILSREARLLNALEGADRIRVRSGGTCCRVLGEEMTLFEETDPAKVAEVIRSIEIQETFLSSFWCKCCGNPSFEFYKSGELVQTVGYHHGKTIRWPGGWDSDAHLTEGSAAYLNRWLAEHRVRVDLPPPGGL